MIKFLKVFVLVLVSLGLLSGTVSAFETQTKGVLLDDDGEETHYSTREETVGDFLANEGIVLKDIDQINLPMDEKLSETFVTDIVITRGYFVTVVIDGKPERLPVEGGLRIGNLIAQLNRERDTEFTCSENLDTLISRDDEIILSTEITKTETIKEEIPFETIVKLDDQLEKDVVELIQTGENGEKEIEIQIVYSKGNELYRDVISEKITKEPVNAIERRGTKEEVVEVERELGETVDEKHLKYSKAIKMRATAYTAGYESTGKRPGDRGYGVTASGLHVRDGIVAVDPDVIPLGTELYVEGYGFALAADTGGAINGNKIDLFYDSVKDATKFGRKTLTVYVLE